MSNCLAVYIVELYAIVLAFEWVEQYKPGKVLICSDTTSALTNLKAGRSNTPQDLIGKMMSMHSRAVDRGTAIIFIWVPAHVGIRGNEKVDKLAKT